jgi:hypothetical protein
MFGFSPGFHRHVGRRGAVHILKDDGSLNMSEGKSSRRVVSSHGAHEVRIIFAKSSATLFSSLLQLI